MDHVAFRMPMLINTVPVDLDKLLENSGPTSRTLDGEPRRIMEVAINGAVVLVIRILRTEYGRTNGAREVLDMIFSICRNSNFSFLSKTRKKEDEQNEPKAVI